jgi:hypothetical protein
VRLALVVAVPEEGEGVARHRPIAFRAAIVSAAIYTPLLASHRCRYFVQSSIRMSPG